MNKLLMYLMSFILLFTISCDDDSDNIVGGGIIDEPDLIGCEAAPFYDWSDFQFETSLDAGATTWLGFDLDETTLFSINLNQAGFHCAIFQECAGELGSPPPLYSFMSNGNGQEVGIVTEGSYYLEITNTRPGRLDFTFDISLNDIVYGCLNDDALNYDDTANVDDGSCEFNNCSTDWFTINYGDMVLDCNGICAPVDWLGDGWCDDGAYAIYPSEEAYNNYQDCSYNGGENCDQYLTPINLYCSELNFDEGDCEVIDEGCTPGLIEDCNGICAPAGWLGDGFCDDGSYEYNGNPIFFNCEEFDFDNGDCVGQGRTTQRTSNRIFIGK
jgi:hypothetical protein